MKICVNPVRCSRFWHVQIQTSKNVFFGLFSYASGIFCGAFLVSLLIVLQNFSKSGRGMSLILGSDNILHIHILYRRTNRYIRQISLHIRILSRYLRVLLLKFDICLWTRNSLLSSFPLSSFSSSLYSMRFCSEIFMSCKLYVLSQPRIGTLTTSLYR